VKHNYRQGWRRFSENKKTVRSNQKGSNPSNFQYLLRHEHGVLISGPVRINVFRCWGRLDLCGNRGRGVLRHGKELKRNGRQGGLKPRSKRASLPRRWTEERKGTRFLHEGKKIGWNKSRSRSRGRERKRKRRRSAR